MVVLRGIWTHRSVVINNYRITFLMAAYTNPILEKIYLKWQTCCAVVLWDLPAVDNHYIYVPAYFCENRDNKLNTWLD
jgi:hypothetical protein